MHFFLDKELMSSYLKHEPHRKGAQKMETVNFVMMVVVPAACALVALWCMVWPVREV